MLKRKLNKDNFMKAVILFSLFGFMLLFSQCNSPSNLVKRTLQNDYSIMITDVHLERTGNNTYRLINAPVDSLSGIQLENWSVEYPGIGFSSLVKSLDIPPDYKKNRSIKFHITDEHYGQLQELADKQGISLEQAARDMLLHELNRQ